MHRLAALPGAERDGAAGTFVEQPPAPVLLLSSADTDLLTIHRLLEREPELLGAELRVLNLAALSHPAVIDHYLASTVRQARIVVVRLLGGRGHWSYGLERLQMWAEDEPSRQLLVLAGTSEEERTLASLSSGRIWCWVWPVACGRGGRSMGDGCCTPWRRCWRGSVRRRPSPSPCRIPCPTTGAPSRDPGWG